MSVMYSNVSSVSGLSYSVLRLLNLGRPILPGQRLLMVGSDGRAIALTEFLARVSNGKCELRGYLDDRWQCECSPESHKRLHLGALDDLAELFDKMPIDELVVTLPLDWTSRTGEKIMALAHQHGVRVWRLDVEPSSSNRKLLKGSSSEGLHVVKDYPVRRWKSVSKRTLDIFISAMAIAGLAPIMAAIAIAIKLTSNGPVIFSQERLGLRRRPFRIWKFRTMVSDAEKRQIELEHLNEANGAHFKIKHDPRVTMIGGFLRKTSLDELPQLFNVFCGHMSLVGPRPIVMRDYCGISDESHRRRFAVKPGITCLWQISGRNALTFDRWMELDLEYIDRCSLLLDMRILLKTLPAVVRGSGAM